MAITSVKVHPSIGIARVGNSPDEFFIGPETADLPDAPPGGYKDAQCRIKRQAARFRVFAYHDDGTPPEELTTATAQITWRVRVANTKQSLNIGPSERTVSGPNARAVFDDGLVGSLHVPLGEVRTESDGRLIVLGGFGAAGQSGGQAYDDVADGYVRAIVVVGGSTFEAAPGWVIVGPPDHAPRVRPVITLYDRLYESFGLPTPATTRFRRDVYPILQAARSHRGVNQQVGAAHTTIDESLFPLPQAARTAVVAKLKQDGGNMPKLNGGAQLTAVQHTALVRWRDADPAFVDDWATPPAPLPETPDELDRGPLSHAIGASFAPGIEAGNNMINGTVHWAEPFRVDATATSPGDATSSMVLPWQADWAACGTFWWPSQRPNQVVPQGTTSYIDWTAGVTDMNTDWHTLGFVVPDSGDLVEVERCAAPYIVLLTPALNFVDVQQGPGGAPSSRLQAVVFEVITTVQADFEIVSGADSNGFSRFTTGQVGTGATGATAAKVLLWVKYTTGAAGSSVTGSVTVRHVQSNRQWTVSLAANTVARVAAAVALVLDRSGSMSEPRGDALTKMDSLKTAAHLFTSVALEGDQIACVAFNQDVTAQLAATTLGPITDPNDVGRAAVNGFIDQLAPGGSTSIGDGIATATQLLGAAPATSRKAMVVVTDGKENAPAFIADVAGQITADSFAVGIGRPDNVDVATLQALTGNNGGYLLVTGPIAGDSQFVLTKYFMQILAGVSNAEVVLDPTGVLVPGQQQRIPFQVTDADMMLDVVLLSPAAGQVDFRMVTPLGHEITPATAAALAEVDHVVSDQGRYYRVRVPVEVVAQRPSQAGLWHAVLSMRGGGVEAVVRRAVPFSLLVHAWSDVSLRAALQQMDTRPGTEVTVTATLSYFGAPYQGQAAAWAEVTHPDGHQQRVELAAESDGRFRGRFVAVGAGSHRVRVRAQGFTQAGWLFQREQTLTAATSYDPGGGRGGGVGGDCCADLVDCLARGLTDEARGRLRHVIDVEAVEKCLHAKRRTPAGEDG
jgi:Mg-chelatase subunit ChlD